MDVNKVIIIGRAGINPETHKDGEIAKISIATSYKYKETEKTEWHKVAAFGKLAEILAKYVQKGNKVYIEGRLQTNVYEKDGEKKYNTEIIANQIINLSEKKRSDDIKNDPNSHSKYKHDDDVPF
jgi:single-strand DNA-binding protein